MDPIWTQLRNLNETGTMPDFAHLNFRGAEALSTFRYEKATKEPRE
jgi:hypothetical protein